MKKEKSADADFFLVSHQLFSTAFKLFINLLDIGLFLLVS